MTPHQIAAFADSIGAMLLSHAAHGQALFALEGMGEITLRDGLVVAAAASAARMKQAWIIEREILPDGWSDASVDMVVSGKGHHDTEKPIGGVELKWWRQTDAGNSSNRRRDLVKDFLRAAALYSLVSDFSFVVLLSTAASWSSSTSTTGKDKSLMALINGSGEQRWRVRDLIGAPSMYNSLDFLKKKVPIASAFVSKLLAVKALQDDGKDVAFVKVWSVRKTQNSTFIETDDVIELVKASKPKPKKKLNPVEAPE